MKHIKSLLTEVVEDCDKILDELPVLHLVTQDRTVFQVKQNLHSVMARMVDLETSLEVSISECLEEEQNTKLYQAVHKLLEL